ncbi:MAG: uracil-DNA glycosylase family protein [Thiolinea sp.]
MKTENTPETLRQTKLVQHQHELHQCRRCPEMIPPVITGNAVLSKIMLIGQAPGIHEAEVQKPFGWTAGKTLFRWFEEIGVAEEQFRKQVYIAAVCRCFPGKQVNKQGKTGGDRVPSTTEISNCSPWLQREIELLQPRLIIPVGKLAISQFIPVKKLNEVIGQVHQTEVSGHHTELIPLPHPSGASTWHRMEPGKTLLQQALTEIAAHPDWPGNTNKSDKLNGVR